MLSSPLDNYEDGEGVHRTTSWRRSGIARPQSTFQTTVGQAKGETIWACSI